MNNILLPDHDSLALQLKTWQTVHPELAGMMASGTPAHAAISQAGWKMLKLNNPREAVKLFQAATALNPGDAASWLNLGNAFEKAGNLAEAAKSLGQCLALDSKNPTAWVLLGMVQARQGDKTTGETSYRNALAADPGCLAAWQCLGLSKQEQKQLPEAIECFKQCAALDPKNPAAPALLGRLSFETGKVEDAAAYYRKASAMDPANPAHHRMTARMDRLTQIIHGADPETVANAGAGNPDPAPVQEQLEDAFHYFNGFGYRDAALRTGEAFLRLHPGHAVMSYHMAALKGDGNVTQSPEAYLVETFGNFADRFDAQLVELLDYDVPRKMVKAIQEFAAKQTYDRVLDAGCGTGLCGKALRPVCKHLTGVDISRQMLEQASLKKVYDQLVCGEIVSQMNHHPDEYDLITAADVLIYLGDLEKVFKAAAHSLKSQGVFAFSIEASDQPGFKLLSSGRFAHHPSYVLEKSMPAFEKLACLPITVRKEAHQPLAGFILVLQKS